MNPRATRERLVDVAAWKLRTAAGVLAASVLTDSAAEHYRAGFHNRAMFVGPAVAAATLAATRSASGRHPARTTRGVVFALAAITGIAGFAFHLTNIARRAGGWTSGNLFNGAPAAAPLALTTAGVLGIAAGQLGGSEGQWYGRPLGLVAASGLLAASTEAGLFHFRGAFQNPLMYFPVVVPPLSALALGAATVNPSASAVPRARAALRVTGWLGVIGVAFHAWGVHRRMGGWRNWRQNLLVGPPLPAPPAFTSLALAGQAALLLLASERGR